MRSVQKLFDIVVNHLRLQNCRSTNSARFCRYRNSKGHKCAVGALIPDKEYLASMEGKTVYQLISWSLLTKNRKLEFFSHRRLLIKLQSIHDGSDIRDWEKLWRNLAKTYKLKYTAS